MNDAHYYVDPDITVAHTLPTSLYRDTQVYEACIESAFATSWQFVGDTSLCKAPGSVHPFTMLPGSLDEPVVLVRDMDDGLHLLSNVCTHRGNLVCEGGGNERFLRCRYHGKRFGLDGKFHSMPEFDGVKGFPTPLDDLTKIPLEAWGPLLFGSLSPAAGFSDVLSWVNNRLGWLPLHEFKYDPDRSRDYLVRGHWALYVDNYLEGFHIPFIHAGLNQSLDYENYVYELFPYGNLQLGVAKPGEDCFDLPSTSADYGQSIAAYYYWLFPNTMLNFYPWGLSINVVKPQDLELTRVSFISYVWREDRVEQGAGASLDRVEREDEAVIETVQRGVKSRFYKQGRYSSKREIGTHQFHRLLAASLSGSMNAVNTTIGT